MISKLNDMMSICNTLEKVCKVSSFIISVINWEITTLKFYICKSFPIINEKNLPLSLSFQIMFSKVQSLSRVWLFATPGLQNAKLPSSSPTPRAQTHCHRVSDAIQSSHPSLSPSPPAFNLSQHQGLFTWVCYSHQVAKVLEFQLQHQSFQWIFRTDFPQDRLVGSPFFPRDSQGVPLWLSW